MKHILIFAGILASMVSCSALENGEPGSGRSFALHLTITSDAATKGVSEEDDVISRAGICLWNGDGRFLFRRDVEAGGEILIDSLFPGTYSVSVLAGDFRFFDVSSLHDYRNLPITVEDAVSGAGLLMNGGVDIVLSNDDVSADIQVERYLSRLHLKEIVNDIGEAVLLKGAMLINVPAVWTVGAQDEPSGWLNLAGRVDGEVITLFTAQAANLTYSDLGSTLLAPGESCKPGSLFYCFPNNVQDDAFGPQAGFGKTRLVVVAQIGDVLTYYPATIAPSEGMLRNTSYDVSMKLHSYGSSDPNTFVPSGVLTIKVSPSDYDNVEYKEMI